MYQLAASFVWRNVKCGDEMKASELSSTEIK
jgi:hypothetical protein